MHKGVGIIPTNADHSLFYIQRKDDDYRIKAYRGFYSFFGGKIEPGETEADALSRELGEEVPGSIRVLAVRDFKFTLIVPSALGRYQFTLYESVLSDKSLDRLASLTVLEGFGHLVPKEDLHNLPFIHGLESAVTQYLETIKGNGS